MRVFILFLSITVHAVGYAFHCHLSDSTLSAIAIEDSSISIQQLLKKEKKKRTFRVPFEGYHATNYIIGPSAIPYEKGRGQYRNNMLLINQVGYGLTKNILISAGFEISSLLILKPVWFVNAKAAFDITEKWHVGGGYMHIQSSEGIEASQYIGVITWGDKDLNISAGLGYGKLKKLETNEPLYFLSAYYQMNYAAGMIMESYLLPTPFGDPQIFSMLGVRIVAGEGAVDLSAAYTSADFFVDSPLIPVLGYSLRF